MERKSYAVIIVTYYSALCIVDLLNDIHQMGANCLERSLIIDNNSLDETVMKIQSKYPQVKIIQNIENVGYGKAVIQGVLEIDSSLFFLLNPDIRLPPKFFSDLVSVFHSDEFGAIGPLQYKQKGIRSFPLTYILVFELEQ